MRPYDSPVRLHLVKTCTHRLTCALVALCCAVSVSADTIALRHRVAIESTQIRLRDIATLKGAQAEALGDTIVLSALPAVQSVRISLDDVRRVLSERKVNWARISLGGFRQCVVDRHAAPARVEVEPVVERSDRTPSGPAAANPAAPIELDSKLTVGAKVIQFLKDLAGGNADDVSVTFADHDAATVHASINGDRIEINSQSRGRLGRIPITIRRYRQGRLVDTSRVSATVKRDVLAVVVKRAIPRGQIVARGDLEVRALTIEHAHVVPLTEVEQAIGLRAVASLRRDMLVEPSHLALPIAVERGKLLTIECVGGALRVTTVARALEAGAVGDVIQVRNERSRKSFAVTLTGRSRATMVIGSHPSDGLPQRTAALSPSRQ